MRLIQLAALILSLAAYAAPDGGYDVELLDAGVVLPTQMACMTPDTAVAFDVGMRSAERDRDSYRGLVLVVTPIAVVATIAAGVLAVAYAAKK